MNRLDLAADVMASMNKNFSTTDSNVNVQVGASLNDMLEESEHYEGGSPPSSLTSFRLRQHLHHTDEARRKANGTTCTVSTGSAGNGWDSQYCLTVTGCNDWASMLVFTDKMSYFYPR